MFRSFHGRIVTKIKMKQYKDLIKTILQALTYLALLFLFYNNPIVAIFIGAFWLFVWSFNISDKIQYRRKKYPNELRFPTQNDSFFNTTSLIIGFIAVTGSLAWIIRMSEFSFTPIILLLAGLLISINGLLDLPKGKLKIENLSITLQGVKGEISVADIRSIAVLTERLTILSNDNKQLRLGNLELTDQWIAKIEAFLKLHLNTENIEIKMP